jgi:hypothetical protein
MARRRSSEMGPHRGDGRPGGRPSPTCGAVRHRPPGCPSTALLLRPTRRRHAGECAEKAVQQDRRAVRWRAGRYLGTHVGGGTPPVLPAPARGVGLRTWLLLVKGCEVWRPGVTARSRALQRNDVQRHQAAGSARLSSAGRVANRRRGGAQVREIGRLVLHVAPPSSRAVSGHVTTSPRTKRHHSATTQ